MSLTKTVLLDLIHLTGMVLTSGGRSLSYAYLNRESYERICAARERRAREQAFRRLQQQKLIAVRKRGEGMTVRLTEKGRDVALKQTILNVKRELPRGHCCLASFDFPETVKGSRGVFRDFLRKAGFRQVQKSVWQSRRDVAVPPRTLVRTLDVGDWVKVYIAREI